MFEAVLNCQMGWCYPSPPHPPPAPSPGSLQLSFWRFRGSTPPPFPQVPRAGHYWQQGPWVGFCGFSWPHTFFLETRQVYSEEHRLLQGEGPRSKPGPPAYWPGPYPCGASVAHPENGGDLCSLSSYGEDFGELICAECWEACMILF